MKESGGSNSTTTGTGGSVVIPTAITPSSSSASKPSTNPTKSQVRRALVPKNHSTQGRKKCDMGGTVVKCGNINEVTTEDVVDVRHWFTSLPSGEERACATSISDVVFIQAYLSLASSRENEKEEKSPDTSTDRPSPVVKTDKPLRAKKDTPMAVPRLNHHVGNIDVISSNNDITSNETGLLLDGSPLLTMSPVSRHCNFIDAPTPTVKEFDLVEKNDEPTALTLKHIDSFDDHDEESKETQILLSMEEGHSPHETEVKDMTESDVAFDMESTTGAESQSQKTQNAITVSPPIISTTEEVSLEQKLISDNTDVNEPISISPLSPEVPRMPTTTDTIENETGSDEIKLSLQFDNGETITIVTVDKNETKSGEKQTTDPEKDLFPKHINSPTEHVLQPGDSVATRGTVPVHSGTNSEVVASKIIASQALSKLTDNKRWKKRATESSTPSKTQPLISETDCGESSAVDLPRHVNPDMSKACSIVDDLHDQVRLIVSSHGKVFSNSEKSEGNALVEEGLLTFNHMTLDPSFLQCKSGETFLKMASKIIQCQNHTQSDTVPGFLSTTPSIDNKDAIMNGQVKMNMLPKWIRGIEGFGAGDVNAQLTPKVNGESTGTKSMLPHLMFLAKIEMAIWGSYYRHMHRRNYTLSLSIGTDEASALPSENAESVKPCRGNVPFQPHSPELMSTFRSAEKLHKYEADITPSQSSIFLEPLTKLGMIETENNRLDNMLLVPFCWLIPSRVAKDGQGAQNHVAIFSESLRTVLQRVHKSIDQFKTTSPPFVDDVDVDEVAASMGNDFASGANKAANSKKKRKKKKNKKKKPSKAVLSTADKHPIPSPTADTTTSDSTLSQAVKKSQTNPPTVEESSKAHQKDVNDNTPNTATSPGLTLQMVEGSGATCVVVEKAKSVIPSADESSAQNDDSWSRVETKSRSARGKKGSRSSGNSYSSTDYANVSFDTSTNSFKGGSKSKSKRTSDSRRRSGNRKTVKDILNQILDDVDDEVVQRKKQAIRDQHEERKKKLDEKKAAARSARPERTDKFSSLRDIVAGTVGSGLMSVDHLVAGKSCKSKSLPVKPVNVPHASVIPEKNVKLNRLSSKELPKDVKTQHRSKMLSSRPHVNPSADQNTAPTLPETLSGVSATSNSNNEDCVYVEFVQEESGSSASSEVIPPKVKSNSPPLPTLLSGPGNMNSATSSVASSLEANNGQHSRGKECDVGYHLLSVCDRLSNDMMTFMSRRALALAARRRERGVLLNALQDTAEKIWAGRCYVEMYGSCATQLDLPSSDLDVVICGLSHHKLSKKKKGTDTMMDHHHHPHSINAGRVRRLGAELECQPWAVQVKAIPTASVPVIKILADPARLPGLITPCPTASHDINQANGTEWTPSVSPPVRGEWMMHAAASQSVPVNPQVPGDTVPTPLPPGATMAPFPVPWRGADVMNGLISVDITFQGPEHGGVGSTAYAATVVQDSCNETGLPPESTPGVQLIMVLKELLAQRRLNEPFSGGLSSYALLLMVVAVMKERKAIHAEMELAERQSRAVTASCGIPPRLSNHARSKDGALASIKGRRSESNLMKRNKSSNSLVSEGAASYSAIVAPVSAAASVATSVSTSSWLSVAKRKVEVKPTSRLNKEKTCSTLHQRSNEAVEKKDTVSDIPETRTVTASNHSTPSVASRIISSRLPESRDGYSNVTPNLNENASAPVTNGVSSSRLSHGSNDILEVLCSGKPTAGKLLMHFLLFYGKYFDAMTMSVDVTALDSGRGPYLARKTAGVIDPITGMLTVDPIIVFDPLEGAEGNNVSRSCFAWHSIRWVFAQCFNTLTHNLERKGKEEVDTNPLLELLLSY